MKKLRLLSIILISICASTLFANQEIVTKQSDNSHWESISFRVENDIFFSDRYYTNGLKLSYATEGDDFLTSRLQFAILRAFVSDGQVYQTVSLGQKMCVSSDINIPNPPDGDRPYAGWLYLGFGSHIAKRDSLDSLTVNLGVVGPYSLAEDAQKFWHSLTGCDKPMGWHNQIKNEPAVVISYEHNERIFRRDLTDDFSTDVVASIAAELGNVITQGRVGAIWRFGYNMPYSFSSSKMNASDSPEVMWRPTDISPDWHLFMYGGGTARFVGYDITLDGNTYRDSYSVASKWLVGEAVAGVSTRYKAFQADLTWSLSTSEYHNQKHSPHMYWSLMLRVFY